MFELRRKGNISYYVVPSFEATGLVNHCISTREGGVSEGIYSSMNFRFNCDDKRGNVIENFKRISDAIGIDYTKLVLSHQTHGDIIHTVEESDAGNGIMFENKFESVDGLITDKPGIGLVTLYADCVPTMFLDKRQGVIATSHSGWKGTVKRIAAKTIQRLAADYGSKPEDILCAIGPSIQLDHFEVGDEVAEIFIQNFGEDTAVKYGKKYHVDMQLAIIRQLTAEGVPVSNIDNSGICTYCNSELLFSHRKTQGRRGNFGAVIALK